MWIKMQPLSGFGQWQKQRFDFVDGLQVVQGLNEAVKQPCNSCWGCCLAFRKLKGTRSILTNRLSRDLMVVICIL